MSTILGNDTVKELLFGLVGAVLGGVTTKILYDREDDEIYDED